MAFAARLLSVTRGRQQYDPVSDRDTYNENDVEEDKDAERRSNHTSRSAADSHSSRRTWVLTAWLGAAFLVTALLSFLLGTKYANTNCPANPTAADSDARQVIKEVPLGTVISAYEYNESFAQVPVKGQAEPSWDSLVPVGLGYIRDEDPNRNNLSVISVFHQLHCLYTLRRAFFSSTGYNVTKPSPSSSSPTDTPLEDFDFGLDRLPHAQHCFEYLRLSLMCNADSRVEPVDLTAGEFFGWDVPRKCRNYQQLKDWAEERRAFDATGFLAPEVLKGDIKVHGQHSGNNSHGSEHG